VRLGLLDVSKMMGHVIDGAHVGQPVAPQLEQLSHPHTHSIIYMSDR